MRRNHDGQYGKCGPGDGTGFTRVPKQDADAVLGEADQGATLGQGYASQEHDSYQVPGEAMIPHAGHIKKRV